MATAVFQTQSCNIQQFCFRCENPLFRKNFLNLTNIVLYYALINRARGPYEEIFVLTFKAYGPNVRSVSIRLECQNKYFPYGPKSRLIRALLYTYTNKIVNDEILLVYCVSALPGPYAHVRTASQPIRSNNSFRI